MVASSRVVANNCCVCRLGVASGLHIVFVSLYLYTHAMPYGSMLLLLPSVCMRSEGYGIYLFCVSVCVCLSISSYSCATGTKPAHE